MLPKKAAKPKQKKRASVNKGAELHPWPFRPYQQDAIDAFDAGKRRQLLIWHRRAGKDCFGLSLARREAQLNVGGYWHFFPKHVQARRAIWNGVDPKLGRNFIDVAFGDILAHRNNTEMFLELDSGSTWQLLGSDNYDRLVGGNARGVIFSEWALCDPRAWDYIRPIILENKGWALFITTFRGRNHAWQMVQGLRGNPDWHVDIRTVDDTRDVNGEPIISADDIEKERREGTSEAIIQQEYFCNPAAAVVGAVYGAQAQRLRESSNRTAARWQPLNPVVATWDFSQAPNSAAVVYSQKTASGLRVLAAELLSAMTVPECIARSRSHPWKVTEHAIAEESEPLVNVLSDLRVYPDIVRTRKPGHVETVTQAAIETMECDAAHCGELLDSLSGYTRHDITEDALRPMFEDYDVTWHMQLARAFELAALHEYDGGLGGGWHRAQRYTNADKRAI